MPPTKESDRKSWLLASGTSMLVIGLALVALSVVWPKISTGNSTWTENKAEAYQAASEELHSLSMQMAATPPEQQSRARADALAEAESKYTALRIELEDARERPARIATILRYTGIALAALGAVTLWTRRDASQAA